MKKINKMFINKNNVLFFAALSFVGIMTAMSQPCHTSYLHEPLDGFIDPQLRNWLLEKLACIGKFSYHESPVCQAKFTPDEQSIVTRSYDGTICTRNLATGLCKRINRTGLYKLIHDHKKTAIMPLDCMYIRNSDNGNRERILKAYLTSDRSTITTVSFHNGLVRIFDIATGECRCTIDRGPRYSQYCVNHVKFIPQHHRIIIRSFNDSHMNIGSWNTKTATQLTEHEYPRTKPPINSMKVSPDGNRVANEIIYGNHDCKYYQKIEIWDIATMQKRQLICNNLYSWTSGEYNSEERSTELFGNYARKMAFDSENSIILCYKTHLTRTNLKTDRKECATFAMKGDRVPNQPLLLLSSDAHTVITLSKDFAYVWNMPGKTLRLVLTNPLSTFTSCPTELSEGFFAQLCGYCVRLIKDSNDKIFVSKNGNCMICITNYGCHVQVFNICKERPLERYKQLSVYQVALLHELMHREHNRGYRLILRPDSENYKAYQALSPSIKKSIRNLIGICTRTEKNIPK